MGPGGQAARHIGGRVRACTILRAAIGRVHALCQRTGWPCAESDMLFRQWPRGGCDFGAAFDPQSDNRPTPQLHLVLAPVSAYAIDIMYSRSAETAAAIT